MGEPLFLTSLKSLAVLISSSILNILQLSLLINASSKLPSRSPPVSLFFLLSLFYKQSLSAVPTLKCWCKKKKVLMSARVQLWPFFFSSHHVLANTYMLMSLKSVWSPNLFWSLDPNSQLPAGQLHLDDSWASQTQCIQLTKIPVILFSPCCLFHWVLPLFTVTWARNLGVFLSPSFLNKISVSHWVLTHLPSIEKSVPSPELWFPSLSCIFDPKSGTLIFILFTDSFESLFNLTQVSLIPQEVATLTPLSYSSPNDNSYHIIHSTNLYWAAPMHQTLF